MWKPIIKSLAYIWGTFAFLFACIVFFPLGNFGILFAVFGSPVAIFVAPFYAGVTRGVWLPSLVLYGTLVALSVLGGATRAFEQPKGDKDS